MHCSTKDYMLLEYFESDDQESLKLVSLYPTKWSLKELDKIYKIGFGDHLPMTPADHIQILEHGTVLGVVNSDNRLIAKRAMVHDWSYSLPIDTPFFSEQEILPYLNHTVVHPDYRGSIVISKIWEHSVMWLQKHNYNALRTSVAPWNLKSIGYHLKNGSKVTNFMLDFYGPGEHRFHAVFDKDNQNTAYQQKKEFCRRMQENEIPILGDSSLTNNTVAVRMTEEESLAKQNEQTLKFLDLYLNQEGYDGVSLLRSCDIWPEKECPDSYLILAKNDLKNKTRYIPNESDSLTRQFHSIKPDILIRSQEGHYHSLHYAFQRPEECFEFQYNSDTEVEPDAPMVLHPLQIESNWISMGSLQNTQLKKFYLKEAPDFKRLYALDATGCLTGSIKDHATEFVSTFVNQQPFIKGTVLATTGNMGASEAAGMRKIGKVAHAFIPQKTPIAKVDKIRKFGGEVHIVEGTYDDAVQEAKSFAKNNPEFLYSGETVIRLAGNAITSKMIVDKMSSVPNYIFVPVGDGAHFYGLLRGFLDLKRVNYQKSSAPPKIIGVQVDRCNPIYQAYSQNTLHISPQIPDTRAEAVAVGAPLYGEKILESLKENPEWGGIMSVPEEEIHEAQNKISTCIGVKVEESTALVWIAFEKMLKKNKLKPDDQVLLLLTGHQSNTKKI